MEECKFCGDSVGRVGNSFCSNKCQHLHGWGLRKKQFESDGFWQGVKNDTSLNRFNKRYLLDVRGHCCEICGQTSWMGKVIPLILDHVNGNSDDHSLANLRLVCGNCDMQLPTYKSRNRGRGRAWRRFRYADGKSY
jgi:5-methylcytosine-specific restriction endonuclease McrA